MLKPHQEYMSAPISPILWPAMPGVEHFPYKWRLGRGREKQSSRPALSVWNWRFYKARLVEDKKGQQPAPSKAGS